MTDRPSSFHFGPRSRRGLIAGIQTSQLVIIAISLIVAVMALRNVHGAARGVFVVLVLCVGIGIAFCPVNGRTPTEWVPVIVRFVLDRVSGRQKSVTSPKVDRQMVGCPSLFRNLTVLQLPPHAFHSPFGVIHDASMSTWSAMLALDGAAFALSSDEEQTRRVAAWAMVLAGAAKDSSRLYRLQWIERTLPESATHLHDHFQHNGSPPQIDEQQALRRARQSYAQLLEREAAGTKRHELLLAVAVQGARRNKGGRLAKNLMELEQVALRSLEAELNNISRRCGEAGIKVRGSLSIDEVRAHLQRGFAVRPTSGATSHPWPTALSENWSAVCTDGTWHSTYWVAEWPRSEVTAGFLSPLLIGSNERRTVSVVMSPVPPLKAMRLAERDKTADVADADLRRRHGFTATARTSREQEAVVRREGELADGHAAYRFSAYITVTATDRVELEQACARIEQAGAASRLELRRLYGAQGDALCNGLPIGRGCS